MIQEYEYYQDVRQDKIEKRTFLLFVIILTCFFSLIFVTNIFFQSNYRYITVNGLSMQPTLNQNPVKVDGKAVQDGVYIKLLKNKSTNELDYGDIVILDETDEFGKTIIKRYLAKGGDKISIFKVNINGSEEYRFVRIKSGSTVPEVIEESYLEGDVYNCLIDSYEQLGYTKWSREAYYSVVSVKYESWFYSTFFNPDSFIYNPDSEIYQNDYRSYVPYTHSISTYTVQYDGQTYNNVLFYEVPQNDMFYMGDNRTNSQDARMNGTEAVSKVIGKVVKVTRNSTSSQNSIFWLFSRTKGYLEIIWDEIVNYFAWKA